MAKMKILRLRFKNINSFKGEWEICFDRSPLSDAGVFAITGPNGSGKTTILDAITLGLYGETCRLKAPKEMIMTRNTGECYSEVTFSIRDTLFRSLWSIHRGEKDPAGNIQTPHMELYELNGEEKLVEEKINRVRTRISALTGLDFQRFTRSILLPQGEFSAFLHALDNERAELLEKITGEEVYTSFSKTLSEEIAAKKAENERNKARKNEITPISRQDLASMEEELARYKEDAKATDEAFQEARKRKEWFDEKNRLENEIRINQVSIQDMEEKKLGVIHDLEEAEKASASKGFQEEIEAIDTGSRLIEEAKQEIESLQKTLPPLEEELKSISEKRLSVSFALQEQKQDQYEERIRLETILELDNSIQETEENIRTWKSRTQENENQLRTNKKIIKEIRRDIQKQEAHFRKAEKNLQKEAAEDSLESDLTIISGRMENLLQTRKELEAFENRVKDTENAYTKSLGKINQYQEGVDRLKQEAHDAQKQKDALDQQMEEVLKEETRDSLNDQIARTRNHLYTLLHIKDLSGSLSTAEKEKKDLGKKAEKDKKERKKAEFELEETSARLENARAVRNRLIRAVHLETMHHQYEKDRRYLAKGYPCPLCGSVDHPYLSGKAPEIGDSTSALKAQEKKVLSIREKKDEITEKIKRLRIQTRIALKDKEDEIRSIHKSYHHAASELETPPAVTDPKAIAKRISREKTREKNLIQQKKKVDSFFSKAKSVEKLLKKKQEKHAYIKNRLEDEKVILSKMAEEAARIEQERKSFLALEEQKIGALEEYLARYGESAPPRGREAVFLERLHERAKGRKARMGQLEKMQEEIIAIQEKSRSLENTNEDLKKEIKELRGKIPSAEKEKKAKEKKRKKEYGEEDPQKGLDILNEALKPFEEEYIQLTRKMDVLTQNMDEKTREIGDKTGNMEKLAKEIETLTSHVQARGEELGFADIDALRAGLVLFSGKEKIEEEKQRIDNEILLMEARIHKCKEELKKFETDQEISEEEEREKHKELLRQKKLTEETVESLEHTISLKKREKSEYETLEDMVARLEKEIKEMENDLEKINTASGPELRSIVQSRTLDRLLSRTNHNLQSVKSSFQVARAKDSALGIAVVDTSVNGKTRGVNTLSGGESFVVSLCLALGLSDLASTHTRIDSLFLDEGFGALDDETLYSVLSTLEGLHANGKTVGMISHVKALKNRIPTQIRLSRMEGGFSTMEIIA